MLKNVNYENSQFKTNEKNKIPSYIKDKSFLLNLIGGEYHAKHGIMSIIYMSFSTRNNYAKHSDYPNNDRGFAPNTFFNK